jgi:GNAT superfamily N-acetyltransferase
MPEEAVLIRQFQPQDAVACSRIVRACLELDAQFPPAAKQEILRAEIPELMCERARCFYAAVLVAGDEVTALGGVELNEIRLLCVSPSRWRQGMGRSLLTHLESWVPPALFSDIFVYAAPGAVKFYRAHGYQPEGEQVFVAGSGSVPTVFMTKRLFR